MLSPTPTEPTPVEEFVAGMRELADWVEANPDAFDPPDQGQWYLLDYCTTREDLAQAAARLGGRREKAADDGYLNVSRNFGPIRLTAFSPHENVCRKVVKGTRVIPAQPEQVVPAQPERHEEIVEWVCDEPLLAALPGRDEQNDTPLGPGEFIDDHGRRRYSAARLNEPAG